MSRTIFGAMAVVLSACILAMNGARAGDASDSGEHDGAGCWPVYRISHSDSTCLDATWDNSANTWSVTNSCASYGNINVLEAVDAGSTDPYGTDAATVPIQ